MNDPELKTVFPAHDSAGELVRLRTLMRAAYAIMTPEQKEKLLAQGVISSHDELIEKTAKTASGSNIRHLKIQRWEVGGGAEPAAPDEPTFDVQIQEHGGQICIDVQPVEIDQEAPVLVLLSVTLEINHGLPCVHFHTRKCDELQFSVFAGPSGELKIRQGDLESCVTDMVVDKGFSLDSFRRINPLVELAGSDTDAPR